MFSPKKYGDPRLLSNSTGKAIAPLRDCLSRVCMCINFAGTMDSPIVIRVYGLGVCSPQKNRRTLTGSLLKPFGIGIVKGASLGCATMTGDRVSFPLSQRVNNGQLMCFNRDSSNEVQYAT